MFRFGRIGSEVLDGYAGTASAGVACMAMGMKYTGLLGIIKISISCRCGEERAVPPSRANHLAEYLVCRKVKCDLQRFSYNVQIRQCHRIKGEFFRGVKATGECSFLP